jgi:parallel beta-helix repeat protein
VPSRYPTIQSAINAAVDGDTIIVAPGTYIGEGNRDIDFLSKAITVRSTDPNDSNIVSDTIIDCQGTESERHRGFYFHNNEYANSILTGLTITNGYVSIAPPGGGGIACQGSSPTISNCRIIDNTAYYNGGGGIYCNGSNPIITNCTITGNLSTEYSIGGGICCYDSSPKITYCTITGNSAEYGGGIYCYGSNPMIANCTITNNSAALGGGIYCNDSNPTIANCTITNNSSNGGGICCRYNSNPIIINCAITGNSANRGGGIYCDNSSPTITNCTITGNSAKMDGGGIYCYDSNATINNCSIMNNSAKYDAGGIYFDRCYSPTITNCIISNNNSGLSCIFCYDSNATITDCTVMNNSVSGDGAVCCNDGSLSITNCIISSNIISGIYCERCIATITGCTIRDINGTGIRLSRCIPIITNCKINNNSDSGIYCSGGTIINNCTITDNSTKYDGGGIFCPTGDLTVTDCNISGNSANRGGGIYGYHNRSTIINCNISCNSAHSCGGGIHDCDGPITNCIITGNSTGNEGGGLIYCDGPIKNCTITGNSANYGGGLYSCHGTIKNSTVTDNSAKKYGGGLADFGRGPIKNSIIWGNWPDQIFGSLISINYSDVQGGYAGPGNIDADPCFIEAGYWVDANDPNIIVEPNDPNAVWLDGDYRLLFNSPCIDTGDPNYVAEPNETDLDGNPRIFDGDRDGIALVDMGAYEYQNTPPVAIAGPNQSVYAWLDGFTDINLDGSASYDDDNDVLDYYWSWTIGGDIYEANGVNPTIKLPVGIHSIELVVDDGIDLSEPAYCTITVINAVRGRLILSPNVLQSKSCGKWLIATLFIPSVPGEKVNTTVPLRLYPSGIEAKYQRFYRYGFSRFSPMFAVAFFDKQQVIDALGTGNFDVSVVGQFLSGRFLFGSDFIRIISPPLPPPHHRR